MSGTSGFFTCAPVNAPSITFAAVSAIGDADRTQRRQRAAMPSFAPFCIATSNASSIDAFAIIAELGVLGSGRAMASRSRSFISAESLKLQRVVHDLFHQHHRAASGKVSTIPPCPIPMAPGPAWPREYKCGGHISSPSHLARLILPVASSAPQYSALVECPGNVHGMPAVAANSNLELLLHYAAGSPGAMPGMISWLRILCTRSKTLPAHCG